MSSVAHEIEVSAGTQVVHYLILGAVVLGGGYYLYTVVSKAAHDAVDSAKKSVSDAVDAAAQKVSDAANTVNPLSDKSVTAQAGSSIADWVHDTWPSTSDEQLKKMLGY